ncbi:DinB family protein, partial [Streptacidiphilus neutrinimicus]|uniref:DinB family protein n=1 Tax=Streptacidiphilus neutrinimicus TaxID=105420 RepID=UPI0005A7F5BD
MTHPRRRAELFGGAESDPRFGTPTVGDEREVLTGVLDAQRATLEAKCAGLGAELADRSVPPSTLSLLGLVRHLADVERRWFRRALAGQEVPDRYATPEWPDADFDAATGDPALIAAAWAAWREEVAFARSFTAAAPDLDLTGQDSWRGRVSLRWVLIHMVEEYA